MKNSLVLINGTIISQIINVIMSPFMSRLYTPEDFGKYSTITAIIIIVTVIANGKYDLAIMDSKDNAKQRKDTYYGGMIFTITISFIILLCGIVFSILSWINYSIIDVLAIAIFTFFSSNNSIVNIWLNKNGFYKQISRNRIIYSAVNFIGILIFGIFRFRYLGIVFSVFFAYLIQFLYVYNFLHNKTNFNKFKFNRKDTIAQLKKHIKFPKFQMPALLLNNASTQLPVLLFNKFLGNAVSGWYSMTVKVINLPMTIVGSAIGDVYFKEASEIYINDKERLKSFTYNTFKKLRLLGLIPMCALVGYGDVLFSFVLGSNWNMAGIYAMLLAPWYYITFVTSPFTHLFTVLNEQKKNLIVNIIMLSSRVISIILGFLIWGAESLYTVALFSMVGFIIWVLLNGYLFKEIEIRYRDSVIKTIIIFSLVSIIIVIPRIIFKF